eukprot:sb/3475781/
MRFKPPPPDSDIGWRVEFRTIEAQLTDFENAAFVSFCILLSRALVSFNCNFYLPLSYVQENMKRAQQRNAVLDQKFYFRLVHTGYRFTITNYVQSDRNFRQTYDAVNTQYKQHIKIDKGYNPF